MTSMPASRNARAITFAPRSCPSNPGLAINTLIFFSVIRRFSMCRNGLLHYSSREIVLDADLVTVGQGFSVKLCGTLRLRAIFSLFIVPYKASDAVLQNWNIEVDESTESGCG